ncbi:MAG: DUF5689 domain-containing protein [Pedobacter sp.]|uniref:DUF5689 domain-containing protein n=1 Tax=Pedobacter sp. TaxID=1411316 RepID=UPI0028078F28|nr:DUF5689 domain-containing protein [Pedobacter sp.]MDQ8004580.1 DUF5689 domain-containing protein [Pedobacter sp.]
MKRFILNIIWLFSALTVLVSCDKNGNFPGASVSPYIAIYDLRSFYKGADFALTEKSMLGYTSVTGVVVSDHRGKNLTSGLLMVQDKMRLNELRGISINIGADAEKYVPGDSVTVNLVGGTMKRVDGLLQVTGLTGSVVNKVASGKNIPVNRVPSSFLLADPDKYESTELVIVKGGFDPIPAPTDTYSGDRLVNDGFGNFTLHTEAAATFANTPLPGMANFFGVVQYTKDNSGKYVPHLRVRRPEDVTVLSSTVTRAAIIISGYLPMPEGTPNTNGEYIQLLATRDIDFSVTPFSIVTHNTNSAYLPTGVPLNGWATTGRRSYKFNLTSGTVTKGQYFYIGGNSNKLINGVGSTSIANAKWIVARNTGSVAGDGIGDANADLLLNGTSAFTDGIAVFEGTTVTKTTIPMDVIITGFNGAILNIAQEAGLRIANTDWYDIVNPVTLEPQPFYKQGSNTICLTRPAPTNAGFFYKLGGEYNIRLGRWVSARAQNRVDLTVTSVLDELEKEFPTGTLPTKVVE